MERTKVFISYCHKDRKWLDRLLIHLQPIVSSKDLLLWDDTKLKPGDKWETKIIWSINSAKFAVLLVSANFLASDYIMKKELPYLIKAEKAQMLILLPLIISPCNYRISPQLSQYHSINDPSLPLIKISKYKQEEIFAKISQEIAEGLEKISRGLEQIKEGLGQIIHEANHMVENSTGIETIIIKEEPNAALKEEGTKFVEEQLPLIISKMPSTHHENSIIFLDIDDLTKINKVFSRTVGDAVLEVILGILNSHSVFRYKGRCGDDTFFGVMFKTDDLKTYTYCEKLRTEILTYRWGSIVTNLHVTCTVGYSILRFNENPFSFFIRAIQGLLEGKKKGGNQVVMGPQFSGAKEFIEEDKTNEKNDLTEQKIKKKLTLEERDKFESQRKQPFKPVSFSLRDYFT